MVPKVLWVSSVSSVLSVPKVPRVSSVPRVLSVPGVRLGRKSERKLLLFR